MEKYKAQIMRVSNSKYLDPAVITSITLRVIHWDSTEGWLGRPQKLIYFNAGMASPLGN